MNKIWKVYFVFYALLVLLGLAASFVDSKSGSLQNFDALLSLSSLWIVYAWAWQRRLIGWGNTKHLLSAYLGLLIIIDIAANFSNASTMSATALVAQTLFYVVFAVPAYIAIYLYIKNFDKLMRNRKNGRK